MKIISNFKDYFDYLQGVYGVDEKVIYERTPYSKVDSKGNWIKTPVFKPSYKDNENISKRNTKREAHIIAICGVMYHVFILNRGKSFYFGLNSKEYKEGKYKHITSKLDKETFKWFEEEIYSVSGSHGFGYHGIGKENKFHLKETDLNEKENCPVLLLSSNRSKLSVVAKNIKLSDFGISQIISPHDVYVMISNFLSREVPVVDKRTDIQKIVGKGFDKKTSFRKEKA